MAETAQENGSCLEEDFKKGKKKTGRGTSYPIYSTLPKHWRVNIWMKPHAAMGTTSGIGTSAITSLPKRKPHCKSNIRGYHLSYALLQSRFWTSMLQRYASASCLKVIGPTNRAGPS
jgi:hypothetical protein